jgi:hypothetical protein
MFTRMTGELVKTMRACPQPIIAAIDGVCAGAGAIMAMASDMRLGTARSKTAFLFNRVGLAGCDMGACAMLPRIIGQGRASELLYTGRSLGGEEGERWGFFNRLCEPESVLAEAQKLAADLAAGPSFANGITKTMLHQEWAMTIEQAIEAEAQAQALCMLTEDFSRAYHAFVAKQNRSFKETDMADTSYLKWPFFEAPSRTSGAVAGCLGQAEHCACAWPRCGCRMPQTGQGPGRGRLAAACGCGTAYGGAGEQIDTRAICLIRETLARHSGLADFAFAMQGLGSGAISLAGSEEQKKRYLSLVARGEAISALRCPSPTPARTWRPWPARPGWKVITM